MQKDVFDQPAISRCALGRKLTSAVQSWKLKHFEELSSARFSAIRSGIGIGSSGVLK